MSENNAKAFADLSKGNPVVQALLSEPEKRKALGLFCREDFENIDYLLENPWIDLKTIVEVAGRIMDIAPEISKDDLLTLLCKETAILTKATGATCRTYDPTKSFLLASGSYNWDIKRETIIPCENTIAGFVIKMKTPYCVPDISTEPLYEGKETILSQGINSMLALPILVTDYEKAEKKYILIGTLQLYFKEKNKKFYPEQIRLLMSIVNRFSYILALQSKRELQRRAEIIQESRRALIFILKKARSLNQVLAFIVEKIADLIHVNRCSLFTIERDYSGKRFAVLLAGFPLLPHEHTYGIALPFSEYPAFAEVCDTGEPLLIEEAKNDPRMKASYTLYLNKKIKNVYFIPLKDEKDSVTNVLVLDGDESRPLEKDELQFCHVLMQDIELCIQTALYSQQLHDFFNQILSLSAIAKLYTKKQASPNATVEELNLYYKKLKGSLLSVEDIIADRHPLANKERFNLNEIIYERLDSYYFLPQVAIRENTSEGELFINADPKKVGRMVGNLLDNAYKKLEALKGGVLEVITSSEGSHAVISIGNTGIVPREVLENLSKEKPFLGLEQESGLGLVVVKLFTVMHNGIFEYESSPEKNWTIFRIKLPINPVI
jgi:hypothetical protein